MTRNGSNLFVISSGGGSLVDNSGSGVVVLTVLDANANILKSSYQTGQTAANDVETANCKITTNLSDYFIYSFKAGGNIQTYINSLSGGTFSDTDVYEYSYSSGSRELRGIAVTSKYVIQSFSSRNNAAFRIFTMGSNLAATTVKEYHATTEFGDPDISFTRSATAGVKPYAVFGITSIDVTNYQHCIMGFDIENAASVGTDQEFISYTRYEAGGQGAIQSFQIGQQTGNFIGALISYTGQANTLPRFAYMVLDLNLANGETSENLYFNLESGLTNSQVIDLYVANLPGRVDILLFHLNLQEFVLINIPSFDPSRDAATWSGITSMSTAAYKFTFAATPSFRTAASGTDWYIGGTVNEFGDDTAAYFTGYDTAFYFKIDLNSPFAFQDTCYALATGTVTAGIASASWADDKFNIFTSASSYVDVIDVDTSTAPDAPDDIITTYVPIDYIPSTGDVCFQDVSEISLEDQIYQGATGVETYTHADFTVTAMMGDFGDISTCDYSSLTIEAVSTEPSGVTYDGLTRTWDLDFGGGASGQTIELTIQVDGVDAAGPYIFDVLNVVPGANIPCSASTVTTISSMFVGEPEETIEYQFSDGDGTDSFTAGSFIVASSNITPLVPVFNANPSQGTNDIKLDPQTNDEAGIYSLTITITDDDTATGGANPLSCTVKFDFTIYAVNHPQDLRTVPFTQPAPFITPIPPFKRKDTFSHEFDMVFTDPDLTDNVQVSVTFSLEMSPFTTRDTSVPGYETINVVPVDNTHIGTYLLTYHITDDNSVGDPRGIKSQTYSQNIVIEPWNFDPVLDNKDQYDIHIQVKQDTRYLVFPSYSDIDLIDSHTLSLESEATKMMKFLEFVDVRDKGDHLECFIKPYDNSQADLYLVTYMVTDDNAYGGSNGILSDSHSFFLEIIPWNHFPQVEPEDIVSITLEIMEQKSYFFGITDEDPDDIHFIWVYTIVNGVEKKKPDFVYVDNDKKRVKIYPTLAEEEGSYELLIRIEDTDSVEEGVIKYHEDYMTVTITYTRPVIPPQEDEVDNLLEGKGNFEAEITEITDTGMMLITFEKTVISRADAHEMDHLDLRIELISRYPDSKADNQLQGWSFEKLTSRRLFIQLNFTDPMKVSNYQELDKIRVTFLNPVLFLSEDSLDFIEKDYEIERRVPAQIGDDFAFLGDGYASDAIAATLGLTVALSFLVKFLLNIAVSLIWTLMNTLQIIVHIPLVNLAFPSNAMRTSLFFTAIANFDVIPHEQINKLVFDFEIFGVATPVRFQLLDFPNYNFVTNSGTTLWLIFIWIGGSLLTILLGFCKGFKLVNYIYKKLYSSLFFGMIVRILLECYLELALSCLLNMKSILFSYSGETFAVVCALFMLVVILFLPIVLQVFLFNKRRDLDKEEIASKFKETYSGIKQDNQHALFYNSYFLFRRLFYSLSLVFLGSFPFTQIALLMVSAYVVILYTIKFQPFEQRLSNIMEITNEFTILSLAYITFCFSDYIPDYETKLNIGFAYSCIIFFSVGINLLVVVFVTFYVPLHMRATRIHRRKTYFRRKWKYNLEQRRKNQINVTEMGLKMDADKNSINNSDGSSVGKSFISGSYSGKHNKNKKAPMTGKVKKFPGIGGGSGENARSIKRKNKSHRRKRGFGNCFINDFIPHDLTKYDKLRNKKKKELSSFEVNNEDEREIGAAYNL